ncbi:hypothetical protein SU69_01935 [Thermosipho melanesiensis]|uniref:Uncharacterized protein-like protein n=2 Tax=Thermosipho melanesiensis TaxID=46541 RepID=A6LJY9_THEM4|nr:DUF2089 domain-containing protein [Thermosipho melanesiensis]ABR30240.1 Uncharacterized protein-like protein [Thermosipho melanesiensis BI429]APT73428.1 hypothetical protein BW47_02015 [Thermosipho melanesiensis]OOC37371.1 hypothetical protein SU68_01945 [Thermosipho melanesiensis]OOC39733.1 hypothetical protein SU69_01935 [Thermosipho melanesiensis]OOC39838.1 hypothetical protein SU70_01930 [Thermosipho melanesiensis]
MLPKCPVCGKTMIVTQLKCQNDDVIVSGKFTVSPLAFLEEEDMKFIILFLRSKGNLKEMERITGIGYFTLRGKLDKLLNKMGLTPLEESSEETDDIFSKLKKGIISVEDALNILKKKGGEKNG